jgi:hypothetical protein
MTPRTRDISEIPAKDWDWILGLYYSDGCKFKDQWHYAVVFTLSTSEHQILAKLLRILRETGLAPSVYKKAGREALDVRSYSKRFFSLFPAKSTLYRPAIPLAYLGGLFDGDGCITFHDGTERWVFSQAKYPHLAEQARDIIASYGDATLRIVLRKNGWLPIYRLSVLKNARESLKNNEFASYCVRLAAFIQTIDERCASKNWSRGPDFHRMVLF